MITAPLLWGRIASWAAYLARILTLNIGHDALWPKGCVCVILEEGIVIQARRIFSRIEVRGARTYPLDTDSPAAAIDRALDDLGASRKQITLVLARSRVITRTVEMPSSVAGALSRAVEFELDRLTPLAPGDALYDYTVMEEKDEKIMLRLSVCRSDAIAPLMAALKERGITVGRVTTDLGGPDHAVHSRTPVSPLAQRALIDALMPSAQDMDLLAKGARTRTRPPLALTLLLCLAIAAALVTYAILPLTIEQKRTAEIDAQIRALKNPVRQVEQLKKEIGTQEKENGVIEGFRGNRVLAIDILREITKILPKNVWLTRARITDTTVDLEGYAGSAAEILPRLEASPLLKKVEFASPTFRDARLNADRFVIKMEIENDKVKGEPKK